MLDPFMKSLGFEAEIPAPGQARVWAELKPEHLNNWGSAHGGFLYTLADSAFALASNSRGCLAVALSTHMEYIKASRPGTRLEAAAQEIHFGRSTSVYRVEVRAGETLLAMFTGTAFRKADKPPALSVP